MSTQFNQVFKQTTNELLFSNGRGMSQDEFHYGDNRVNTRLAVDEFKLWNKVAAVFYNGITQYFPVVSFGKKEYQVLQGFMHAALKLDYEHSFGKRIVSGRYLEDRFDRIFLAGGSLNNSLAINYKVDALASSKGFTWTLGDVGGNDIKPLARSTHWRLCLGVIAMDFDLASEQMASGRNVFVLSDYKEDVLFDGLLSEVGDLNRAVATVEFENAELQSERPVDGGNELGYKTLIAVTHSYFGRRVNDAVIWSRDLSKLSCILEGFKLYDPA